MSALSKQLRQWAVPDLPDSMLADFVVSAARQVNKQAQWLFLALLCTTPFAVLATPAGMGWLVRWGLPVAMAAYCLFGLVKLRSVGDLLDNPRFAKRFVVEASISSVIGAVICTSWAILSWLGAEGSERLHFPVMLVMGSLATAYCMASVRLGAVLHLIIDIGPISILLMTSGSMLDLAAGVSMVLAGLFQWRMINVHHRQVIELLWLRRHSQQQAQIDPLTVMLNRRALHDIVTAMGEDRTSVRLLLIDVDRFKSINDIHGHDMGDQVLIEVARRIDAHGGAGITAARLGGEEFALLGDADSLPAATALAVLGAVRDAAMPHGEQVTVSIGIAEGVLDDETAWRALYRLADEALFAAKRDGRNRHAHAVVGECAAPDGQSFAESAPRAA